MIRAGATLAGDERRADGAARPAVGPVRTLSSDRSTGDAQDDSRRYGLGIDGHADGGVVKHYYLTI